MIKSIDTRGYSCPEPVIMTKNAIETSNGAPLAIYTDSGAPRENVKRFAEYSGYSVTEEIFEDGFKLNLQK